MMRLLLFLLCIAEVSLYTAFQNIAGPIYSPLIILVVSFSIGFLGLRLAQGPFLKYRDGSEVRQRIVKITGTLAFLGLSAWMVVMLLPAFRQVPMNEEAYSDVMLTYIHMIKNFTHGKPAFESFFHGGYTISPAYLPFQWMPFVISELLNFDYRWIAMSSVMLASAYFFYQNIRNSEYGGVFWQLIVPVWPLVIASVISLAIIGERAWSLRSSVVTPAGLLQQVVQEYRQNGVDPMAIARLSGGAPLAQIFAAGLKNVKSTPQVMKEAIDDTGRAVAHDLERFLNTLGTIASISPLLGLLGTVIGMIEIFGSQAPSGTNPIVLAHGISIALYNTAMGLIVAIPSMIFYRFYRSKVDSLIVTGVSTSGCVRATVIDAFSNNYRVAVVGEACFDRVQVGEQDPLRVLAEASSGAIDQIDDALGGGGGALGAGPQVEHLAAGVVVVVHGARRGRLQVGHQRLGQRPVARIRQLAAAGRPGVAGGASPRASARTPSTARASASAPHTS